MCLEDGAQAPPRSAFRSIACWANGVQRLVREFELHVLEVEQPLGTGGPGRFSAG